MCVCSGPHNVEANAEVRKKFWLMSPVRNFHSSQWLGVWYPVLIIHPCVESAHVLELTWDGWKYNVSHSPI